jgi:hypothetical protein
MRRLIIIAMTILPVFAHAESSHRELLLRAMKSPSGTASMEISGPMADMIRGQINRPNAKIVADVITVGDLPTSRVQALRGTVHDSRYALADKGRTSSDVGRRVEAQYVRERDAPGRRRGKRASAKD